MLTDRVFFSAFGWDKAKFLPENASTFSNTLDDVGLYLLIVSIFFTLTISALLVLFAIKYRKRPGNEIAHELPINYKLETAWSILPFFIVLIAFLWGGREYLRVLTPPSNADAIYIVGKQWMWHLQHQSGIREMNELHVPVGRDIQIIMISEDVIHSFFVPAFRMKFDALPGRYTRAWFNAQEIGEYRILCAEYCGTDHSMMTGMVRVLSESDYKGWENKKKQELPQAEFPSERGKKLFSENGCISCHDSSISPSHSRSEPIGPGLHGLFGSLVPITGGRPLAIADESYIRESILNPQARVVAGYPNVMPTYVGQLSEGDILDLIAYIRSVRE